MLEIKKQELDLGKQYFGMIDQLKSYVNYDSEAEILAFLYSNPEQYFTKDDICNRLHLKLKDVSNCLQYLLLFPKVVITKSEQAFTENDTFRYSNDLSDVRGNSEKLEEILNSLKDFENSSTKFNTVMNLIFKVFNMEGLHTSNYERRYLVELLCRGEDCRKGPQFFRYDDDFKILEGFVVSNEEDDACKGKSVIPVRHVNCLQEKLPKADMLKMFMEEIDFHSLYLAFCKKVYQNWTEELHWVFGNLDKAILEKLNKGNFFSKQLVKDTIQFYVNTYEETNNVKRKIPPQIVNAFFIEYYSSICRNVRKKGSIYIINGKPKEPKIHFDWYVKGLC